MMERIGQLLALLAMIATLEAIDTGPRVSVIFEESALAPPPANTSERDAWHEATREQLSNLADAMSEDIALIDSRSRATAEMLTAVADSLTEIAQRVDGGGALPRVFWSIANDGSVGQPGPLLFDAISTTGAAHFACLYNDRLAIRAARDQQRIKRPMAIDQARSVLPAADLIVIDVEAWEKADGVSGYSPEDLRRYMEVRADVAMLLGASWTPAVIAGTAYNLQSGRFDPYFDDAVIVLFAYLATETDDEEGEIATAIDLIETKWPSAEIAVMLTPRYTPRAGVGGPVPIARQRSVARAAFAAGAASVGVWSGDAIGQDQELAELLTAIDEEANR